jgi:hypothetical protein
MGAVAVETAKGVLALIASSVASEEYSQRFTPERSYADWDLELKEIDKAELRDEDKLHVDVLTLTTGQGVNLAARGKYIMPATIDIAVRRKFGRDKLNDDTGRILVDEVDALVLLVEEIAQSLTPQRLNDANLSIWDASDQATQILVNPISEHLRGMRQFTGIIRAKFRCYLPIG